MDDVTIARALHVVSVVLWIGGVAFVTTVLLPTVRRLKARQEQMQLFNQIEQRFAWQARVSTAIVGLTGFYMLYRFDMWDRFRHPAFGGLTRWSRFGCSSQQCFLLSNRSHYADGCLRNPN